MANIKKRALPLLMALVMVFTLLPVYTFAADGIKAGDKVYDEHITLPENLQLGTAQTETVLTCGTDEHSHSDECYNQCDICKGQETFTCYTCEGSGQVDGQVTCSTCEGSGSYTVQCENHTEAKCSKGTHSHGDACYVAVAALVVAGEHTAHHTHGDGECNTNTCPIGYTHDHTAGVTANCNGNNCTVHVHGTGCNTVNCNNQAEHTHDDVTCTAAIAWEVAMGNHPAHHLHNVAASCNSSGCAYSYEHNHEAGYNSTCNDANCNLHVHGTGCNTIKCSTQKEHSHSDACYAAVAALVVAGQHTAHHTHGDGDCNTSNCNNKEEHTHGTNCNGENCTVHVHGSGCNADGCSVGYEHTHKAFYKGGNCGYWNVKEKTWSNCTQTEHTHSSSCCNLEVDDSHTHGANCCTKQEHTHDKTNGGCCSKTEHAYDPNKCCPTKAHTHSSSCCNLETAETHTHSVSCCSKDNHKHTSACCTLYHNCSISECCPTKAHTHNADCCSLDGVTSHTHSTTCCSLTNHAHTDACCNKTVHAYDVNKCCPFTAHAHGDGNCSMVYCENCDNGSGTITKTCSTTMDGKVTCGTCSGTKTLTNCTACGGDGLTDLKTAHDEHAHDESCYTTRTYWVVEEKPNYDNEKSDSALSGILAGLSDIFTEEDIELIEAEWEKLTAGKKWYEILGATDDLKAFIEALEQTRIAEEAAKAAEEAAKKAEEAAKEEAGNQILENLDSDILNSGLIDTGMAGDIADKVIDDFINEHYEELKNDLLNGTLDLEEIADVLQETIEDAVIETVLESAFEKAGVEEVLGMTPTEATDVIREVLDVTEATNDILESAKEQDLSMNDLVLIVLQQTMTGEQMSAEEFAEWFAKGEYDIPTIPDITLPNGTVIEIPEIEIPEIEIPSLSAADALDVLGDVFTAAEDLTAVLERANEIGMSVKDVVALVQEQAEDGITVEDFIEWFSAYNKTPAPQTYALRGVPYTAEELEVMPQEELMNLLRDTFAGNDQVTDLLDAAEFAGMEIYDILIQVNDFADGEATAEDFFNWMLTETGYELPSIEIPEINPEDIQNMAEAQINAALEQIFAARDEALEAVLAHAKKVGLSAREVLEAVIAETMADAKLSIKEFTEWFTSYNFDLPEVELPEINMPQIDLSVLGEYAQKVTDKTQEILSHYGVDVYRSTLEWVIANLTSMSVEEIYGILSDVASGLIDAPHIPSNEEELRALLSGIVNTAADMTDVINHANELGMNATEVVELIKANGINWFLSYTGKTEPEAHEHTFVEGKCECGETDPNYVPEVPHVHSYTVIGTAATCTKDGENVYTCSCGDSYTEVVPSKGHDVVNHDAKNATCTDKGWYAYETCSRCNDYNTYVEIPATGHSYEESTVDSTCTEKGSITYTCSCGASYSNEIPVKNHSYANGKCSVCGNADPEHEHSYSSEITTQPTCTENGVETFTCICGESYTETVVAPGHSYTVVAFEPTCTENGVKTYSCTNCDDSYEEEYGKATGHNYTVVTVEPTCTEKGTKTFTCACGKSYTETIVTIGHSYTVVTVEPTCTENGVKTYSCTNCDDSYEEEYGKATGHNYTVVTVAPTCTEDGVNTYSCSCGHSYDVENGKATGHSYTVVTVEPTCTENGVKTYSCTNCDDSYEEEYGKATGHNYTVVTVAPTCTEDGVKTYSCSCGHSYDVENGKATGHNYTVVTVEPTCTEKGTKTFTCACGDSYSEDIDALGHTYVNGKCHCGADDPNYKPADPTPSVPVIPKPEEPTVEPEEPTVEPEEPTVEPEEPTVEPEEPTVEPEEPTVEPEEPTVEPEEPTVEPEEPTVEPEEPADEPEEPTVEPEEPADEPEEPTTEPEEPADEPEEPTTEPEEPTDEPDPEPTPTEEIPDEEVPMGDGEDVTDIPDEDVPMAANPAVVGGVVTGGLAAAAAIGVVAVKIGTGAAAAGAAAAGAAAAGSAAAGSAAAGSAAAGSAAAGSAAAGAGAGAAKGKGLLSVLKKLFIRK